MSLHQTLVVILVTISVTVIDPVVSQQLNQQCLNCICQASTGCNLSKKCHNSGPSSYSCGPYEISWNYWADSGKPGNQGGPHDFETCLNDKSCAEQAVQGYMAKWARDCNGDGFIDCFDYAAIHKTGPNACNAQWLFDSEYWKVFQSSPCASGHAGVYNDGFDAITPQPGRFPSAGEVINNNNNNQPSFQPQPQPTRWTFPVVRNQTYQPSPSQPSITPSSDPLNQPSLFNGQPENVRFNGYNVPSNPNPNYNNNNNNNANVPRHEVFGSAVGQPPTAPSHTVSGNPGIVNADDFRNYPTSQPSPPLNNAPETGSYSGPSAPSGGGVIQPSSSPISSSSPNNDEPNSGSNSGRPVDPYCLDCLCQASTGCDVNKQCDGNFCGPYLISHPFWSDAGRPGNDYVSCALRKDCAEATIRGYLSRYARDCNKDGVINCDDYVMIHQYGPNCGPGVFGNGKFWQEFTTCTRPPIDARRNRVNRENVERFRPIERPGQPANLRRDEPIITWNGGSNNRAFTENEITGNRPVDRDLNQPERFNSLHNIDDHSAFNPFHSFNSPSNSPSQPPNFNRPNNTNVYFNDVHFPNQPFGPSGPSFGPVLGQPRSNNNDNNNGPRNNFSPPEQPTPIPPHAHVHGPPSSVNRFEPESTINSNFRPIPPENVNINRQRDPRPNENDRRPDFNRNNNNDNNNNNGFRPGVLRNDGFRPIFTNDNNNDRPNPISPPNNFPTQPNNGPVNNANNNNVGNFDPTSARLPTNNERFTPRYDRPNGFNFPSQPGFRPFPGNPELTDPFSRDPRPLTQSPPLLTPSTTVAPPTEFIPTTTVSYSASDDDSPLLPASPGIRDARLLPSKANGSISAECLECICEATSKCEASYPCKNYDGNQACGPYQISISYWLQSGKPGYNGGSSDFINCVTNMNCAQDTLKGYIKTMGRDCNADGIIDCVDYALIHKLGSNACEDQSFLDSPYWNDFQACYGFER